MCNFRVGQKVACINDEPSIRGELAPFKKGDVLTVVKISEGVSVFGPDIGLSFSEVPCIGSYELGYSARRFRPVIERGTDAGMSILRDILTKTDKPVEVDA